MPDDNLRLFDDIERSDLESGKRSVPSWQYLNRSGRPEYGYIRRVVEGWFRDFEASPEKRRELLSKFRNDDNRTHLGAFFELYLHALCKAQGFQIKVEPEWDQGSPDFLLTSPSEETILLEATGIFPDRLFGSAAGLERLILDYLDERTRSPDFFLSLQIQNAPRGNPPYSKMKKVVQNWLDGLVWQEKKRVEDYGTLLWKYESWSIEFSVIPKNDSARGKEDHRPIEVETHWAWVDEGPALKRVIREKSKHYGALDIPYILAINVMEFSVDEEALLDALFGRGVLSVNIETNESRFSRKADGIWIGPRGPRVKQVSGVCIFTELVPETMHKVNPVLWHHPSPSCPLKPELIKLTQQIPIIDNATLSYQLREGVHPATLLQLDQTKMPGWGG